MQRLVKTNPDQEAHYPDKILIAEITPENPKARHHGRRT